MRYVVMTVAAALIGVAIFKRVTAEGPSTPDKPNGMQSRINDPRRDLEETTDNAIAGAVAEVAGGPGGSAGTPTATEG